VHLDDLILESFHGEVYSLHVVLEGLLLESRRYSFNEADLSSDKISRCRAKNSVTVLSWPREENFLKAHSLPFRY